ncbi:MAG: hypothetical protein Gaeavirus5_1 [Gaeavirus sp.]|uniref:Uncharacterized protein n=1 Tax=Gaeavirus sp. TaxID=2487767 RepID=A0A3G5A0G9_9VIRU|nr:MAG: hypothetical protein Gaeavirus5_1 [Gaeavirus sp.]
MDCYNHVDVVKYLQSCDSDLDATFYHIPKRTAVVKPKKYRVVIDKLYSVLNDGRCGVCDVMNAVMHVKNYILKDMEFEDMTFSRMCFGNMVARALPSIDSLTAIKDAVSYKDVRDGSYKKYEVLGVNSGFGAWEKIFEMMDITVVATDERLPSHSFVTVVELSTISAVRRYVDFQVLFVGDVRYDQNWCGTLDTFRGNTLIFISEIVDGHTVNYSLKYIVSRFWNVTIIDLDSWPDRVDKLFICYRKDIL